jgi:hypothetical protein
LRQELLWFQDCASGVAIRGATWAAIDTNLPSLDIHGFTRGPANRAKMCP